MFTHMIIIIFFDHILEKVEGVFSYVIISRTMRMKGTQQGSIEYRSDDVTKIFFWISVFWIPCIGGA